MTVFEVAELLGVTNQCISQWELGQSHPRPKAFRRIADLLGLTVGELADRWDAWQESQTATRAG